MQHALLVTVRYHLVRDLFCVTNSTTRRALCRGSDVDTEHQLGKALRVALPDATWLAVRFSTYLASHCALYLAVDRAIFQD